MRIGGRLIVAAAVLGYTSPTYATPPPPPEPVPAEMLSGISLKLPVGDRVVMIDAPGGGWQWVRIGDDFYSLEDVLSTRGSAYVHWLQLFRVARIPTRAEAQAEYTRQTAAGERKRISSWSASAVPVPGSVRYTMAHTIGAHGRPRVVLGYYTPEGIHLIGPAGDGIDAQVFARILASYRVRPRD